MKNKPLVFAVAALMICQSSPLVFAEGFKQSAASLILPTTGQAMNGELGDTKTKVMAGIEAAAVTTITILGITTGGGVVWVGLAPLIANHAWSSADAFKSARNRQRDPIVEQQLIEAQRAIEYSRNRRADRGQDAPSDIRTRIQTAGQRAYEN